MNLEEHLVQQYESLDNQYWSIFDKLDRAREEFERAKSNLSSLEFDFKQVEEKREEANLHLIEIRELQQRTKGI